MICPPTLRAIVSLLYAVMLLCDFGPNVFASEQTYSPRSEEEVEVLSLVLTSETKANNWTKSELICFSVNRLDPSAALVKSLRQRYSNVRSAAEWRKKFNCGFEVSVEYPDFELSKGTKIHVQTIDLREINQGIAHVAVIVRDVEYSLHKSDGKWLVSDCVPVKKPD